MTIISDQDKDIVEWIPCNSCLRKTKHTVIAKHKKSGFQKYDEYDVWWSTIHALFVCCGCESITLRKVMDFSEAEEEEVEFYPPKVSRKLPKWKDDLPEEIRDLLTEIYSALHADSRTLALMGARTIIDMFILDKIGDIGSFEKKMKALVENEYLGNRQKEILETSIDAGSAAAHRGYKPEADVLEHVIDVIEHLLHFYVLDSVSNLVKNRIPKRPKS